MIQLVTVTIMIIFLQRLSACSSNNQFMAVNDCPCRGYNVTYQCIVFGGAATVWRGTAFDCSFINNEIVILHDINYTSQNPQTCNNGAIIGHVVRAENDSYTSQITVQVSNELNGTTVVCAHDNGTDSIEIGSATLDITTVPFSTNVQLVEQNNTHLSFTWNQVSSRCPSIQYHIEAPNCGECPATTERTTVCNGTIGDISFSPNISTRTPAENLPTSEKGIMIIIRLIVPATVFPIVVLMGITLVLGIALVYLLKSNRTKSNSIINHQSTPGANMVEVELTTTDNNQQGIGVYSYLQSTDNQEQNHNSRSSDDITYADLGPNTAARAAHLQTSTLLHDDRVQYEEIQHEAIAGVPVCGPQTSNQLLVNLDLLLILLKEELTPRWYEFGLIVGVPKDVMDNYLGYPSDQCLIELLDYWLRYHPGQLTWKEVAHVLREMKIYFLAEKALQISTTGKFPLEFASSNFVHHDLVTKESPSRNANKSPSALPHEQQNLGAMKCISSTSEYEDTSGLLSPPPLPPKGKNT